MGPSRRGSRVLALAATLAVAAAAAALSPAARATTGDPVLLNEALLSHSGADTAEFVELYGAPGASLAGLALLAVEGDGSQSPGRVDFRLDFAPTAHLGGNGFYLIGNPDGLGGSPYFVAPDVAIEINEPLEQIFENGSQTLALVDAASAPAVGGTVTESVVVRDTVGVSDNPDDQFFFGAPEVGPDPGGFLPPGVARASDGVDDDGVGDWVMTSNNLDASHTPTAASPYNFPPTTSCSGPVSTVAGTAVAAPVSASDVDGTLVAFSLTVVPPAGSVTVANVVPAAGVGGTATADVAVGSATPAGSYEVTVSASNADATPQEATCQLAVTVEPAPADPTPTPTPESAGPSVGALHDLLGGYLAAGDVSPARAHLLADRLARVEGFLAAGQDDAALAQLHAFANQAQGLSPRWVTPWAADALTRMAGAIVADLASGG
jgi:hypothetical protein